MNLLVALTFAVSASLTSTIQEQVPPVQDPPIKAEAIKEAPAEGDDVAVLETSEGQIILMFHPEKAPKHVENFKALIKKGFYDGTRFHRTIVDFMIQGGDPNSKDLAKANLWGTGGNVGEDGQEITVDAEFTDLKHARGVLSMARSQNINSASSQFFIMHKDSSFLDGKYSAFGSVVEGMDVVDKIVATPVTDRNGTVIRNKAAILMSAKIEKWPIKKDE